MNAQLITVSVVSHEHGDEILMLLDDMVLLAANEVVKIVVTLNVPEDKLFNAIKSRAWPFEVIVINNTTPLGFGVNHNKAFELCQTPYFCVVNPDIRIKKNPYPELLESLSSVGAGCAYPMQRTEHGLPRDLVREIPTPLALMRRYLMPTFEKSEQVKDWINGSFMLFPSGIYNQLQGFDQKFFMYCEDVDICLRLRKFGFKLMPSSNACIQHSGRHASRRHFRHLSWHVFSLMRLWYLKFIGKYDSVFFIGHTPSK